MSYLLKFIVFLFLGVMSSFPLLGNESTFIHIANTQNIVGYTTYLDHPKLNNNEEAIIIVDAYCNKGGKEIEGAIGVSYDGSRWSIFRQDLKLIQREQKFIIVIKSNPTALAFTHHILSANTLKYLSVINHPLLDNNPDALLFTTTKRDKNSPFNNAHIRVYYATSLGKWCLLNHNYKPFSPNLKVNILVNPQEAFTISFTLNKDKKEYIIPEPIKGNKWIDKILITQVRGQKEIPLIRISNKNSLPIVCSPSNDLPLEKIHLNVCVKTFEKETF